MIGHELNIEPTLCAEMPLAHKVPIYTDFMCKDSFKRNELTRRSQASSLQFQEKARGKGRCSQAV